MLIIGSAGSMEETGRILFGLTVMPLLKTMMIGTQETRKMALEQAGGN